VLYQRKLSIQLVTHVSKVVLKTCVVPEKAVNPTCNTSYCKNKANGVYPNLKDCSKYISCSNGYTHIMNCPKDLWYDVNKRYCEHKENATNPGCNAPKSHLTYHLTNQQKKELTYHKHNKPEFCVSKKDGLYQYKLDCHKYIQCSNKITHIMPCPRGLWFDVVKKYCEHKENATNPNCEDHVTTTSDPFVQTFCLNKKAKKYAYPNECTKYIDCDGKGSGHVAFCPKNTNFYPAYSTCVWDQIYHCVSSTTTRFPTTTTSNTTTTTTTTSVPTTTTSVPTTAVKTTTTPVVTVTTRSPYTPPPNFCNSKKNGDYVDPTRCDGFVVCRSGHKPTFVKCPPGLWYNATLGVCAWPDSLQCRRGASAEFCFNKADGSYADPAKYTDFIKCTNGKSVHIPCPDGLWYNEKRQYCDFPENVKTSTTTTSPTPNTPPTTAATTIKTSTTTTQSPYTPDPNFCNTKKNGNYADPTRCDGYVVCRSGHKPTFFKCPAVLWYNATLGVCVWPNSLKCPKEAPQANGFTCSTKQRGVYPSSTKCNIFYICDGTNNAPKEKKCPKHTNFFPRYNMCVASNAFSCEDPTFCSGKDDGDYPNKNNCYGYYRCNNGGTYPKNCDNGYRFNGKACVTSISYVCPNA